MRVVSVLAILTVAIGGAAVGQSPGETLSGLQADYRDETVRAQRLRRDAADAVAEIAALDRQRAALRRTATREDVHLTAQRSRLRELGAREAALVATLSGERGRQGRLLSALQMMSRRPPPPLLIPADKAIDTVRAAILIKAMTPDLQHRADTLVARQAEVGRIRRLAILSSEQLVTSESAQSDRRAEIEDLTTRKRGLVAVLRAEAGQAERAGDVLQARIRALGGRVQAIDETETPSVATRLPGGRTRLAAPLSGPPSVGYGAGSSGLRWRADQASVVAPGDATVDYAGPLKGWGQVVILDLGPGWRAVLAGLDTLSVTTGTRVAQGQALGRTARDGEAYFELRREERPIDPRPWLP